MAGDGGEPVSSAWKSTGTQTTTSIIDSDTDTCAAIIAAAAAANAVSSTAVVTNQSSTSVPSDEGVDVMMEEEISYAIDTTGTTTTTTTCFTPLSTIPLQTMQSSTSSSSSSTNSLLSPLDNTDEVFQNEHYQYVSTYASVRGWKPTSGTWGLWFTNHDRPHFSDATGAILYETSEDALMRAGFIIDLWRDVDSEGWEYSTDFSSLRSVQGKFDRVRRRCWVRPCTVLQGRCVLGGGYCNEEIVADGAGVLFDGELGRLTVTTHRLLFYAHISDSSDDIAMLIIGPEPASAKRLDLPLCFVAPFDEVSSRLDTVLTISLRSIGFSPLLFDFLNISGEGMSLRVFYDRLNVYCFPESSSKYPAFSYTGFYDYVEDDDSSGGEDYRTPTSSLSFFSASATTGWNTYNARREFERLGVLSSTSWRISEINANYSICDTYPSLLSVPSAMTDSDIALVANFRCKGRVPALTWLSPDGIGMLRSGQPLSGVRGFRCAADEALLEMARGDAEKLCIVDARPRLNAWMQAVTKGGGYENAGVEGCGYERSDLSFENIANIHVMREALRRVLIDDDDDPDTGWLHHLRSIVNAAMHVVHLIDEQRCPVLVHCSDGWDRSPQVTALAQLLLDPYYRTLRGFQILLEKEWLTYGHQFSTRLGLGARHFDDQCSPVFLQFLDCVWQVHHQFPHRFQFNEAFLLCIANEIFTCRFGTFLFDTEKQRVENCVKDRSVSLWNFTSYSKFYNTCYDDKLEVGIERVIRRFDVAAITCWDALYRRDKTSLNTLDLLDD